MPATASPPHRPQRQSWSGHPCPIDPAHGALLASKDPAGGWLCPHVDHDGRPRTHPAGGLPRSRARFTTAELEAARDGQAVAS